MGDEKKNSAGETVEKTQEERKIIYAQNSDETQYETSYKAFPLSDYTHAEQTNAHTNERNSFLSTQQNTNLSNQTTLSENSTNTNNIQQKLAETNMQLSRHYSAQYSKYDYSFLEGSNNVSQQYSEYKENTREQPFNSNSSADSSATIQQGQQPSQQAHGKDSDIQIAHSILSADSLLNNHINALWNNFGGQTNVQTPHPVRSLSSEPKSKTDNATVTSLTPLSFSPPVHNQSTPMAPNYTPTITLPVSVPLEHKATLTPLHPAEIRNNSQTPTLIVPSTQLADGFHSSVTPVPPIHRLSHSNVHESHLSNAQVSPSPHSEAVTPLAISDSVAQSESVSNFPQVLQLSSKVSNSQELQVALTPIQLNDSSDPRSQFPYTAITEKAESLLNSSLIPPEATNPTIPATLSNAATPIAPSYPHNQSPNAQHSAVPSPSSATYPDYNTQKHVQLPFLPTFPALIQQPNSFSTQTQDSTATPSQHPTDVTTNSSQFPPLPPISHQTLQLNTHSGQATPVIPSSYSISGIQPTFTTPTFPITPITITQSTFLRSNSVSTYSNQREPAFSPQTDVFITSADHPYAVDISPYRAPILQETNNSPTDYTYNGKNNLLIRRLDEKPTLEKNPFKQDSVILPSTQLQLKPFASADTHDNQTNSTTVSLQPTILPPPLTSPNELTTQPVQQTPSDILLPDPPNNDSSSSNPSKQKGTEHHGMGKSFYYLTSYTTPLTDSFLPNQNSNKTTQDKTQPHLPAPPLPEHTQGHSSDLFSRGKGHSEYATDKPESNIPSFLSHSRSNSPQTDLYSLPTEPPPSHTFLNSRSNSAKSSLSEEDSYPT